jgi:hypothetical protein
MSGQITSRRSLSVLLLTWFNLAMLPCAMAVEGVADRFDAASGPVQVMAEQHMHHAVMESPTCATLQMDCCELGQVAFGDNTAKLEEKKASGATGLVPAPGYLVLRPPTLRRAWRPSDPPDPGGGSPRLHVLHCVYLD